MTRGYLVIAQNNETNDYLTQAYALALNLKLTQVISNLSVCVDKSTKKLIKEKHKNVFDHIIDIPGSDDAKDSKWKINNKWKYYQMSPYDETVILDTDMMFPFDISYWWDILSNKDVWTTVFVKNYREEIIKDDRYHRKAFIDNNLPNIYTAFFYFKKSELAEELFTMIKIIFNNWEKFYQKYIPNPYS